MNRVVAILLILAGCSQATEPVSVFTGKEVTWALQPASTFDVSGTITFKERKDGQITAEVLLSGTSGSVTHPVHLHLGDIATPGADVMLLFQPVTGSTGKSSTTFNKLADDSSITYDQMLSIEACIKIHLSDTGPERDIILAAGNIGTSASRVSGGREAVTVCKSR